MLSFRKLLRSFGSNVSGSALTILAFAVPAMFGTAGLALDFSRVQAARQHAQAILDSALLAALNTPSLTDDVALQTVQSFFARPGALKHDAVMANLQARMDGNSKLRAEADLRVPTTLLQVIGLNKFTARIEARVTKGVGNIEIALVLDTTASMAGARLANLKSAAGQLIDSLFSIPDASSKVKVGLVPFGQYVNVGMGNRHASWMAVPPDTTVTQVQCSNTYPNAVRSNCRIERVHTTLDGQPYSYDAEICDWDYGTPVNVCSPVTTTMTWSGCAGARSNPLNIRDEQYFSRVPGIRNVSCPSPIVPLTHQESEIRNAIEGLSPAGDTFIPTGLTWGWRVLSNREPFAESAADPATANGSVRKYMVLMTDGFNTRSPRYAEGDHEGWDAVEANALTRAACDNIKADHESKIEIFTIAFEVADEGVKDILRYCATPGGAFFDAVDYSRLLSAFSDIGNSVSVARIER